MTDTTLPRPVPDPPYLWWKALGGLVAVVLVGTLVLLAVGPSAPSATGPAQARVFTPVAVGVAAGAPDPSGTTAPGPVGVVSSAVVAENRRPGTTSWIIPDHRGPDGIEGFADLTYAQLGDEVSLYVSTTAPTFRVVAYRMGYYQGLGARQVWVSPRVAGMVQPPCQTTPGINMVSCANWSSSLTFTVTSAFVPGDYLLKLVGSGGEQAYVPLTVWDPGSHAAYLLMNRTFVEEGWNAYGGYSFYQGVGPCPPGSGSYPVCNRARVVSLDRPYDSGDGASDFLSNEYPLVRYAEEHGLDVSYVTDVTVDQHPSVLLQHRALLSLGHDETWSLNERRAAATAVSKGVNIVFFGAASVLRHVRMEPSALGPDRLEVDYRDATEDPLDGHGDPLEVTGNTWASPPASWSEVPLVGELYSGYLKAGAAVPFVVFDSSSWVFRGTGLHDGSALPGLIESDVDHLAPSGEAASDLQVLGHSPIPLADIYTNQGTWGTVTYSDMTYYTDPASKAGVLDTGDNNWINSLTPCPAGTADCPAGQVAAITGNILRLVGSGPAGHFQPSVPNVASVTPPGS